MEIVLKVRRLRAAHLNCGGALHSIASGIVFLACILVACMADGIAECIFALF